MPGHIFCVRNGVVLLPRAGFYIVGPPEIMFFLVTFYFQCVFLDQCWFSLEVYTNLVDSTYRMKMYKTTFLFFFRAAVSMHCVCGPVY